MRGSEVNTDFGPLRTDNLNCRYRIREFLNQNSRMVTKDWRMRLIFRNNSYVKVGEHTFNVYKSTTIFL